MSELIRAHRAKYNIIQLPTIILECLVWVPRLQKSAPNPALTEDKREQNRGTQKEREHQRRQMKAILKIHYHQKDSDERNHLSTLITVIIHNL